MAAAQAVEEAKFKTEASAILWKQQEDSFTVALEAIAHSKALQDTVKKAKEASQKFTQADKEVNNKEVDNKEVDEIDNKISRLSNNKVLDIDEDIDIGDNMVLSEQQSVPKTPNFFNIEPLLYKNKAS